MCEDVKETFDVPITIMDKNFSKLRSKVESSLEKHDNICEKLDNSDLELRLYNGDDSDCEIETMDDFNEYYTDKQDDGIDTIVIKVKFTESSPDPQSDSNEKSKSKNKNKKNSNNNKKNNNNDNESKDNDDDLSDFMPSDQDDDSDDNEFIPTDDEKSDAADITEKAPINVSCSIRSKDGDIYGHVTWELVKDLNKILNDNKFNWVYCVLIENVTTGKQQQVTVNDKNSMQWVGKLPQNEEYAVSVKIMNASSGASSPWSNQVKFKAQSEIANNMNASQTGKNGQGGQPPQGITRLEAPKYIHIQSIGKNMVRLGWEAVSGSIITYHVYETKQHSSFDAAISCSTPFCVVDKLVPNKEYSFKIQAEDESRNEKSLSSEPFSMYFPDISSFVFIVFFSYWCYFVRVVVFIVFCVIFIFVSL